LCTGDLIEENVKEAISNFAGKVYIVQGNMDYLPFPKNFRMEIGKFKIGLIHGHQVYPRGDKKKLASLAIKMDVDILISGHTHALTLDVLKIDEKKILLINPGSITGVWSGGNASYTPSFVTFEAEKGVVNLKSFELKEKNLIEKTLTFAL
jgi:putative phosphoesterase